MSTTDKIIPEIGEENLTQAEADEQGKCVILFPDITAYVVFKMDPVQTLIALGDEETLLKASQIKTKVYAGYMDNVRFKNFNFTSKLTRYPSLPYSPTPIIRSNLSKSFFLDKAFHENQRPSL